MEMKKKRAISIRAAATCALLCQPFGAAFAGANIEKIAEIRGDQMPAKFIEKQLSSQSTCFRYTVLSGSTYYWINGKCVHYP